MTDEEYNIEVEKELTADLYKTTVQNSWGSIMSNTSYSIAIGSKATVTGSYSIALPNNTSKDTDE